MRLLVQRSGNAKCVIDGKIVGKIDSGLVVLVGFTAGDDNEKIQYLVKKLLNLRIFPDASGVMNLSILEYGGEILSISQFTLYGDTTKGNRPSYIKALGGAEAVSLYDEFNRQLSDKIHVETGVFGADMEISLTNIGPTTILLEK